MKKITYLFVCLMTLLVSIQVQAQSKNATPWQIFNMEDATRWGKNADFDDETQVLTFQQGNGDRWIDVPNLKGDLTGHEKMTIEVLESDCVLRVNLRYRDENGKTQQVACQTFWGSMGKTISAKKVLKCDLTNGGKIPAEFFKNVVGIRISMAKGADGTKAPWKVKFGKVCVY